MTLSRLKKLIWKTSKKPDCKIQKQRKLKPSSKGKKRETGNQIKLKNDLVNFIINELPMIIYQRWYLKNSRMVSMKMSSYMLYSNIYSISDWFLAYKMAVFSLKNRLTQYKGMISRDLLPIIRSNNKKNCYTLI